MFYRALRSRAGRRPLLWLLVLTAGLAGCGRNRPAAAERVAVLRFENLSGGDGASADWVGRAFSEVLSTELAPVPGFRVIGTAQLHSFDQALGVRPVSVPGVSGERDLAIAAGATRIGYGQYNWRAGKLEARLTLEDARTGRIVRVVEAQAPAGDVLYAAVQLARELAGGRQVAYPTANARALEEYVRAIEAEGAETIPHLEAAIAADPNFGPAYRTLAHVAMGRGDRAAAMAALERALARGDALDPVERARLGVEVASLGGNAIGQRQALEALAKLQPEDASVWRSLGQASMAGHAYPEAAGAYRRAAALEPENIDSWNQLGYAEAAAGRLDAAMEALQRYQALKPADPNVLDSMGDANLTAGRLKEAEDFYLQAVRKDPSFLGGADWGKAAMARLMTGDVAGADALFKQYLDARAAAKDPALDRRGAEWHWVSARRKEAVRELEASAGRAAVAQARDLAGQAFAELAIWKQLLGDTAGATEAARRAAQMSTPASAGLVSMAQILTAPKATAAEWTARLERAAPGSANPVRDRALGLALLRDGEFRAAADVLAKVYATGGPDEGLAAMLAWCLVASGRAEEAAPLLRANPLPPPDGISPLVSFYFPRIYYLRGAAAEKAGRTAEARATYKLFLDLSGPDPLLWGEESQVRSKL